MHLMAAVGLARLGDASALKIMRRILDSEDPDVEACAAEELHKIEAHFKKPRKPRNITSRSRRGEIPRRRRTRS